MFIARTSPSITLRTASRSQKCGRAHSRLLQPLLMLALAGALLVSPALAGPIESDERVTAITVSLARSLERGDIDPPTYTLLFDLRTKAHAAVTRWLHGGPAYEPAAREAMEALENAL